MAGPVPVMSKAIRVESGDVAKHVFILNAHVPGESPVYL